jgi:hypothetical protein
MAGTKDHLNGQDIGEEDLHRLMGEEDTKASLAEAIEDQEAVLSEDGDPGPSPGMGESEGFEESEELLIRAALGQYRPPEDSNRR